MSMIAMAHPVPHLAFKREFAWEESRHVDHHPARPRSEDRMTLPSIREAFPELHSRLPEMHTRTPSLATSPVVGLGAGAMTPPEYVHSPNTNKRRRLSIGDDRGEERASQVPRLYSSPPIDPQLTGSRGLSPTTMAPRSATESWSSSSRTSPYMAQSANGFPPMRSPTALDMPERVETRPTLPSLPHLAFSREQAPMPRIRGYSSDDAYPQAPRPLMMHPSAQVMEPNAPAYRQRSNYAFAYHHPSRVQSLSLGSIHPLDRTPFSPAGYGHYQDYRGPYEYGGMSMNGDNKQRKRRGNLPKETTDKLRAWFVSHLTHPYPSEDEKQELMRQTGLQMNQISNWFINARRRQLPAMMNSAKVESDVTSALRADGKVLPTTERGDYDDGKRSSVPLSDYDASVYEDDMENIKRREGVVIKRGSV